MPEVIPVFLVITAVIAWFNARYLRLPSTTGVLAAALMLSTAILALDALGHGLARRYATELFGTIDFSAVLMEGMLSVLLFAGALQVDLGHLAKYRWQIGLLAVGGTVAAALLVTITYIVVVFSVLVQGLTIEKLVRKVAPCAD